MENLLRSIPSVDRVLNAPETAAVSAEYPRVLVTRAARNVLERMRSEIKSGGLKALPAMDEIAARVRDEVELLDRGRFCAVVNATGIIVHTGLGRAPLADSAMKAIAETAGGYLALETDLESGGRGSRQDQIEALLCEVTGAEAGMVVNNNAAAVLLVLDTLARGKDVIVSRSELVEIGGSFRMPDVMEKGGVKLVEVGTTNKTRIEDYRNALTDETALLLKVHQSNFRMVGFTQSVSEEDLVALGREFDIPVMHDAGSGAMPPVRKLGFHDEPVIRDSVRAGVDVTTFSGDKLLGGPQAGVMVGTRACIERLRKNPMARALRPGKLTLAALEATLKLYLDDELAAANVPVLKMMGAKLDELSRRARRLAKLIEKTAGGVAVEIEDGFSAVGGGSLPAEELPTRLVAVSVDGVPAGDLAAGLRKSTPPIMALVRGDKVAFDVRTITDDQVKIIAAALSRLTHPH